MNYDQIREYLPDVPLDIIQRLGHDPVTNKPLVCDGVEGPKTRRAVYLPIDKLKAKTSQIALNELLLGAQEINGNNRGRWVNKYFRCREGADERKNRGAWCAAWVTWVLDQAFGFRACWGAIRAVRDLMVRITIDQVQEGDCVAWRSLTRPFPYGHVGLIVLVEDDCIWTIEGNVDLAGDVAGVAARRLSKQGVRSDGNRPYLIGRPKGGQT